MRYCLMDHGPRTVSEFREQIVRWKFRINVLIYLMFYLILELEDMSPLSQCCDGQSVPWQRRNLRCVMMNVDLCFEWQNCSNHNDESPETWNIIVPMEICLDGARMLCSRWYVSPLTMENVSLSTPQTQLLSSSAAINRSRLSHFSRSVLI